MLQFMKNKILIPGVILCIVALFLSFKDSSNRKTTVAANEQNIIMQTVMDILQQGHYSPRPLTDSLSMKTFDDFFETLDYEKKFFLASDLNELGHYRTEIDQEVNNNSLQFFNEVVTTFRKRIEEAKPIYTKYYSTPFTFTANDSIDFKYKNLKFPTTEAERDKRWEQTIKYRVLAKYTDLKEANDQKVKDSANYKSKDFTKLEKEARESMQKVNDRAIKRLSKLTDNELFGIYLNSVLGVMDPHTTYMLPQDKKRFDEMMSGGFIGIGAALQATDEGKVKITSIITGSPSWKNGKMKAEDIIIQVAQGAETPVDIDGYEIDDVIKLIRGKQGTEVRLTIQHSDGSREVVSLIRDQVVYEETFAKSAIIEEDGKKIGYIYLPEFYADFSGSSTGRRSGKDVTIEVEKLMAENVDGIVLDLRNNGGGSLADVVEMSGIFLGQSPVVQVRSSGNTINTLSSKQTAPIYTGPLAVMINGRSASASEILAAVLQDAGRATIIGSNSFGKGTVQTLVALDQFVDRGVTNKIKEAFNTSKGGNAEFDGIGSLKLTIQKFYRINGGSTQIKGVAPDIYLPDPYDQLDIYSEKKDESALPWDKVSAVNYTKWKDPLNNNQLKMKSEARVRNNESFKLIEQTAARLKKQQENNIVYLNYDKFVEKSAESKATNKKLEELEKQDKNKIGITNPKSDLPKTNLDEDTKKKNKEWLEALSKDIYLIETADIMLDAINMN